MPVDIVDRFQEETRRIGAAEKKGRREQLREQLCAAADDYAAAILAQTDGAVRVWESLWADALAGAADRAEHLRALRHILERTGANLAEGLQAAREDARACGHPSPNVLAELERRAADFPLWARECLARWDMLDEPPPPLDPETLARHRAAIERGDYEYIEDILARLEQGGPLVKE